MPDPTVTTVATAAPTPVPAVHTAIADALTHVATDIRAGIHDAVTFSVHTEQEVVAFLQTPPGQATVAAGAATLEALFEAFLPAALPAGAVTLLATIKATPIGVEALTAIENYLSIADAAYVQSLLGRVDMTALAAAYAAITSITRPATPAPK